MTSYYNYWFIQCNHPNSEGKPYYLSGGLVHKDSYLKRNIPDTWDVKPLFEIGTITSGGTPATDNLNYYSENGIAWITPNDLSNNIGNLFIYHGARDITPDGLNNSSATIMPPGSILLSTRAPIGYMAISESEVCTNQGFKSVIPNKGYNTAFIYFTLQSMLPHIHHLGAGTTFSEVSKDALSSLRVICPPIDVVEKFGEEVKPLLQLSLECQKQNRQLISFRNWILPFLMNGQATVSD